MAGLALLAGGLVFGIGTLFALAMGYMSEADEHERQRTAGQM